VALSFGVLAGCPAPRSPGPGALDRRVIELGRSGSVLAGVAARGSTVFASLGAARPAASTAIEAFAPGASASRPTWRADLAGFNGPLAVSGHLVVAALGGAGTVGGLALRGDPAAVLTALDATTGALAWKLAIDATEWAAISALATTADGVVVGGSFSGTLRIADQVVSSAGRADGFVARVTAAGALAWVIRVGGPGADSVAGVAAAGDHLAIAGTFAAGADLLGQPLPAFDERSLHADAFVAELDPAGALRWSQTFGGEADEAVAGVAIDGAGRIAVAATIRDTVHLGGADLVATGPSDGLVAWWLPGGSPGPTLLLGGSDLDGLRAITAVGDHVIVAGFYRGSLHLGDRTLTASGGGDDAFVVELAPGTVLRTWPITGDGREEITALASFPGGFLAGLAHTAAARIDDDQLPSPTDPMTGAALVLRSLP
jgi:outer membrane protein assembly factor BamB